jgi:hypothetical protein
VLQFDAILNEASAAFASPLADALAQEMTATAPANGGYGQQRQSSLDMDSSLESEVEDDEEFVPRTTEQTPLLSATVGSNYTSNNGYNPQDVDMYARRKSGGVSSAQPRQQPQLTVKIPTRHELKGSGRISYSSQSHRGSWKQNQTNLRASKITSSTNNQKKKIVLQELNPAIDDMKDYKMIRLEDFGTASSWLILLLPYIAFLICLVLESDTNLKLTQLGPLRGALDCVREDGLAIINTAVPVNPAPPSSSLSCTYPFELPLQQEGSLLELQNELAPSILSVNSNNNNYNWTTTHKKSNQNNNNNILKGTAFESGILSTIPASANVLYADASFELNSTQAVALVERGMVSTSALLFQRDTTNPPSSLEDEEEWRLVATSRPERLSMACQYNTDASSSLWTCISPRIMQILFAVPGSAILSGGDLRVNILFASSPAPETSDSVWGEKCVYTSDKAYDVLDSVPLDSSGSVDTTTADELIRDLVHGSNYILTHTNSWAEKVDIGGRLVAITISVAFTVYWLRKVGIRGCGYSCWCDCFREQDDHFEVRRGTV